MIIIINVVSNNAKGVMAMLKKLFVITVLLAAISLPVTYAAAGKKCCESKGEQGMMGGKSMMSGGMMSMMSGMHNPDMCKKNAEKLGLSDDQLKKFNALHYEHKKKKITLKAQSDIKQLELDELMSKDNMDLDAIEGKLRDFYDTKVQMKLECLKTHK